MSDIDFVSLSKEIKSMSDISQKELNFVRKSQQSGKGVGF